MAVTTFNNSDKDSTVTLSGGNLVASFGSNSTIGCVRATTSKSTGKVFFEAAVTSTLGGHWRIGLMLATDSLAVEGPSSSAGGIDYGETGDVTGPLFADEGDGYDTGDVIGCAVDFDAHLIWFSKNGTWQLSGDPAAGTGGQPIASSTYFPAWGGTRTASLVSCTINFGSSAFSNSPPSGFIAWDATPSTASMFMMF